MGWFKKGFASLEDEKRKRAQWDKKQNRFWLKPTESPEDGREIIFLDDVPGNWREHNPLVNGTRMGHWYTCRQGADSVDPSCYLCDIDKSRSHTAYQVYAWTILDCTPWKKDDGTIVPFTRKLFIAKFTVAKQMQLRLQRGAIAGNRYYVTRSSSKAFSVGDNMDLVAREEMTEGPGGIPILADKKYWWKDKDGNAQPPTPYDYEKLSEPLSNEELKAIVTGQESWDKDREQDSSKGRSGRSGRSMISDDSVY